MPGATAYLCGYMKRISLLLLLSLSLCGIRAQNALIRNEPLTVGTQWTFQSGILQEARTLNVYLPTDYSPDSSYEVIYLLDGSMDEDFMHISGLTQFLSYPWIADMPPCIVVGIANVDRKRDFTFAPQSDKELQKEFPTSGESANFIRFVKEEVQPLVRKWYKTRGKGCLVGQSLGGLLATEILYFEPELFDRYLIVSPSLWWDHESLHAENVPAPHATMATPCIPPRRRALSSCIRTDQIRMRLYSLLKLVASMRR